MAALYLFASLGIMPSPVIIAHWLGAAVLTDQGAERYPCEDHACGCVSALECWSNCCCHTPHQRLVWAITHGVQPPASVKFSDEQWMAASNAVKAGSADCSLCVAKIHDKLSRGIATPADSPIAEACSSCPTLGSAAANDGGNRTKQAVAQSARPIPGLSISALACKGIRQILAVSVPPALPVCVSDLITLPISAPELALPRDLRPHSRSLDVLTPPPRHA